MSSKGGSQQQQQQHQSSRIPTRTASADLKMKGNLEEKKNARTSGRILSKTVGPKELKENVLPLATIKKHQEPRPVKKPTKR